MCVCLSLFLRVCVYPAEEEKEPKTHLELMAEMRDYKRRRQSYRAKNVHITKKSYTEVKTGVGALFLRVHTAVIHNTDGPCGSGSAGDQGGDQRPLRGAVQTVERGGEGGGLNTV